MARPSTGLTRAAPAWLALAALAMALAGCEDVPEPSPTLPPLPPPAERLDFHWHEDVEVPESARSAIDLLSDWLYGYSLWATEPSIIPEIIYDRSSTELYESIWTASVYPRPMAGTVHAHLVEVVEGAESPPTIIAGLCRNLFQFHRIDERGEPIERDRYVSSGRATLVIGDDGQWIVTEMSSVLGQDLRPVCEAYTPAPATGAPGD